MNFSLIKQQLNKLNKPNSWRNLFKSNMVGSSLLTIRLPKYEYFRASMFVEDILSLSEYEVSFSVPDLISILYDDFLHQVVNGTNQRNLAMKLMKKRENYLYPTKKIDSTVMITDNHARFIERDIPKKQQWITLELLINKRSALRGEVLLMDITAVEPKFELSLNQLISILIIDFVTELKKGNNAQTMNTIVNRLE